MAELELKSEIERLRQALAATEQERSQSAAYGLEILNEKENIQSLYEQSKRDLQELREALNKAVNEQRVSATTVFEKEVQLLNDSDALVASFTHAKQEIEKDLKQTKSQLESAITERDRYLNERDELTKKVESFEQERKNLKLELKDLKSRETKLFNENSELEEENVSLQKQVSNLRGTQVEFESSKHEIQRLQDAVAALNSQLEEVVTLRRITERQMQEALEALQSEREQKYALRKELDKRNTDSSLNWTSLAALKGSPHLANLALRGFNSPNRSGPNAINEGDTSPENAYEDQDGNDTEKSYDIMHDLEMPSIEGSLFDEVHLTEIKKLQQNLEEKENQRSNLNTKLIEIQHKLESKSRQAEETEKKLNIICSLVEETYNDVDLQKVPSALKQQVVQTTTNSPTEDQPANEDVTSTTNDQSPKKVTVLDDFDNIYSHLKILFTEFKSYQELSATSNAKNNVVQIKNEDINLVEQAKTESNEKKNEGSLENMQSDDVQSLKNLLYKKHEQISQLRMIIKSNKDIAQITIENLKSKYNMEKAIVKETMDKLRQDHKRLNEDAATFASLRSHFSARIEEYNSEIEKLQSKLAASEQEKNTLNSILRMAIEQKVMLTQKLEALEMAREDSHVTGGNSNNSNSNNNKNMNGQQPRSGIMRGRGSLNRNTRTPRARGSERR